MGNSCAEMLSLWLVHQLAEDLNDLIIQKDESLSYFHMAVGSTQMQIVTSDELVVQEQMTYGSDGQRSPANSACYGDT
jgi:hypothetical protein